MGENRIPPARQFSASRPTTVLAGLPLWRPLQQATRPAALSGAYRIFPRQNFEKLLGTDFCKGY